MGVTFDLLGGTGAYTYCNCAGYSTIVHERYIAGSNAYFLCPNFDIIIRYKSWGEGCLV